MPHPINVLGGRADADERDSLLPLLAINLTVAIEVPLAEKVDEAVGVLRERLPQVLEHLGGDRGEIAGRVRGRCAGEEAGTQRASQGVTRCEKV